MPGISQEHDGGDDGGETDGNHHDEDNHFGLTPLIPRLLARKEDFAEMIQWHWV